MGALPRPELPPGAHRELVEALHQLHHRAGWPSLRTLGRRAGCSPTTVSAVFSAPRLPGWGLLELIVEHLGGDVDQFHRMWLEAGAADAGGPPAPRLAGRADELKAVRRHLESGSGLLVVTGEAGLGKSRLVSAAVEGATVAVALGSCLPLSHAVPLMPLADALASASSTDGGVRVETLLDGGPSYLRSALARLLPELDDGTGPAPDQRQVFLAVERLLATGLPLVLDDLHWADSETLDLLEHLVARRASVTLLGTWRLDDPALPGATRDWWQRVRRRPGCSVLSLGPLDRAGTAEQIGLLGLPPELVDRVYARSGGRPLFTEQLAAHGGDDLPELLADLLDQRLADLDHDSERVATRLGVADRPLSADDLAAVTGLSDERLDRALHELSDRYLLGPRTMAVALRHPLLAEAARNRLLPHEQQVAHRDLAVVLGGTGAPAAEVAEHWQAAGDAAHELIWRERAARAAMQRVSTAQAATQWLRALELWPAYGPPSAAQHADVLVAAMECLYESAAVELAAGLTQQALDLVPQLDQDRAARVYRSVGETLGSVEGPEASLPLIRRALELREQLPVDLERVRVLLRLSGEVRGTGDYQEAAAVNERAIATATTLADPTLTRQVVGLRAYHQALASDPAAARRTLRQMAAMEPVSGPAKVWDAVLLTAVLLEVDATPAEMEAAAAEGVTVADSEDLVSYWTALLRSNLTQALMAAGRLDDAAGMLDTAVDPGTGRVAEHEFVVDRWPVLIEQALLDCLRGDQRRARALLSRVDRLRITSVANQAERAHRFALVELWGGDPAAAADRARAALQVLASTDASFHGGGLLLLCAWAAGDLAAGRPDPARVGGLVALRGSLRNDPLAADHPIASHRARGAQWDAELGRVAGRSEPAAWARAATAWDALHRPHDAAYCRWRGAQAAIACGQATVAQRLLKRAASDARQHVPLSRAIAATGAYAQGRERP